MNTLKWDRVERFETWMHRLLNAEDTPYLRRVGRLTLLQSVLVRKVGCKFDGLLIGEITPNRRFPDTLLTDK
ncbi:VapE domain-containing protein, partial [Rhizobium ruizarguesonis]